MAQVKNPELERMGTVVESLPNTMFRVQLDDEKREEDHAKEPSVDEENRVLAYLSGKMRLHRIKVLVGDRVLLELEPYGGKARITKRL